MTKADLVEKIAERAKLSKKHSEIVVNTVFQSIIEALTKGDKVELRGFGSFRARDRQSRVGRNPKTGESVEVPSKKVPFFKPGKDLKKLVNGG
jgi:integration host factor subunit beta